MELDKLIIEYTWKNKEPRIAQEMFKVITTKTEQIDSGWVGNGMEQNPESYHACKETQYMIKMALHIREECINQSIYCARIIIFPSE